MPKQIIRYVLWFYYYYTLYSAFLLIFSPINYMQKCITSFKIYCNPFSISSHPLFAFMDQINMELIDEDVLCSYNSSPFPFWPLLPLPDWYLPSLLDYTYQSIGYIFTWTIGDYFHQQEDTASRIWHFIAKSDSGYIFLKYFLLGFWCHLETLLKWSCFTK